MNATRAIARFSLLSVGILASGCPSTGGPSGSLTFDEYVARVAEVDCDYFARCGNQYNFFEVALHSTVTDCPAQLEAYLREVAYGQLELTIDHGTTVFHGDLAAQCLDAFETVSCATFGATGIDACLRTIEGRVADGGACSFSTECASTRCSGASGATCGTCMHVAMLGEACSSTVSCGIYAVCSGGVCVEQAAEGEACDPMVSGACRFGLTCNASHVCAVAPPAASGESCSILTPCATGLACAYDSGSSRCRAPRTDGTCQATIAGPSDCPSGTRCSATTSSTMPGTCMPIPTLGQTCSDVCVAPARCVGGTCVATRVHGESCTSPGECLGGTCTAGVCATPTLCTP